MHFCFVDGLVNIVLEQTKAKYLSNDVINAALKKIQYTQEWGRIMRSNLTRMKGIAFEHNILS